MQVQRFLHNPSGCVEIVNMLLDDSTLPSDATARIFRSATYFLLYRWTRAFGTSPRLPWSSDFLTILIVS
jgi:hypothetical protein